MAWISLWTNQAKSVSGFNGTENNATIIYQNLTTLHGWTHNAVCGLLANLEKESYINPAQWQIGSTIGDWNNSRTGLGLGQWTPPSKLGDVVGYTQADYADGTPQLDFLRTNEGQYTTGLLRSNGDAPYYNLTGVPYYTSIANYSQALDSPQDLALTWMVCWERPSAQYADAVGRQERALYWDGYFGGTSADYVILLESTGNGIANVYPRQANAGDTINLDCVPAQGEVLVDIEGRVISTGQAVALSVTQHQTFPMPPYNIIIYVTFSGQTPPTPQYFKKQSHMPIWMYPYRRL